jgi:Fic family protein
MLQRDGLLDMPVLYLSRYIIATKADYYRLLQSARDENKWDQWCIYMTKGVAATSHSAVTLVKNLRDLMQRRKHELRAKLPKIYSQDLLNLIFRHPYTKIEYVQKEIGVTRLTATKYLEQLCREGFLRKQKLGRTNFYINDELFSLLSKVGSETYC